MSSILFAGAAGEVTGSRHLLKLPMGQVLLDCGLFQGRREESRAKSGRVGSPLPFENRTRASIASPEKWPARHSSPACGVAVNVAAQSVPFACATRWPGCSPVAARIASTTSSAS